jgi:hypothetical protein
MKNHLGLLAGLLVAQLLLIGAFFVFDQPAEQGSGLLDLDPATVSSLTITDADGESIELTSVDGRWQLPGGAAADGAKIQAVLERLADMNSLWPVAATQSSQSRFEVAEDNFQRRLDISADGNEYVVYLGSSPGYRRVHARNQDADDIFSVEFSNFEVPADADEWLDKSQLEADSVTSVRLADGWVLRQEDGSWLVDDGPVDDESVSALVRQLEGMRLLGVFEGDEGSLGEAQTLEVTDAQGTYTLTVRHEPEADVYVVESSRVPGSFTVASYIVEQILVDAAVLAARVDVKLEPPAPLLPATEAEDAPAAAVNR